MADDTEAVEESRRQDRKGMARRNTTAHCSRPISALPNSVLLGPMQVGIFSNGIEPRSWIIFLEERQDLPIFWDGSNSVPLVRCEPFQNRKQPVYASIGEFLSNFVAGKYLEKCSMSLQVSTTKYISDLRLCDSFSRILDQQNQEGKPVTLMLSQKASETPSQGGYAKFSLHIREGNNKKVLWDGSSQVSKMTAKLTQADMRCSVEKCLQNYVAMGYLKDKCQIELTKDPAAKEITIVSLKEKVGSLIKGNFASLVIRNLNHYEDTQNKKARRLKTEEEKDIATSDDENGYSSSTSMPVFLRPTGSSHWATITWADVRSECNDLINAVEETMRDYLLTTSVYSNLQEMKRTLQTAIRRRNRIPDEVWLCYRSLQRAHQNVLNANARGGGRDRRIQSASLITFANASRHSIVDPLAAPGSAVSFNGDNPVNLEQQEGESSCLDILSSTLIRCGIELELYDEETNGLNRIAGVGLGFAVFVAICTVVYYF